MKKSWLLTVVPLLLVCFILPQGASAMKVHRYEHAYLGSWENTHDDCNYPGSTGSIEIKLKQIKKTGRIVLAKTWFNDGRIGDMETKGKIYVENGVKKVRLHYTENDWADSYWIYATITKNRIVGTYEHYFDGCTWGGTVDLTTK